MYCQILPQICIRVRTVLLLRLPKKYTSKIVLLKSELTAKYQLPLVQFGQKIPEGLDLEMAVPV